MLLVLWNPMDQILRLNDTCVTDTRHLSQAGGYPGVFGLRGRDRFRLLPQAESPQSGTYRRRRRRTGSYLSSRLQSLHSRRWS